jgi:hypothetical protein
VACRACEEEKRFDHCGVGSKLLRMDELSLGVMKVFIEMGSELLDLHALFEAGGNDPQSRERVLDVITRLVDSGHLESRGSDFYSLTDKGRSALRNP